MVADSLERRLRVFMDEELGLDGVEVGRDDDLLSTGVIDSADLARLADFVEQQVGIAVPDRDVSARHFDSIARILAYVEARREG